MFFLIFFTLLDNNSDSDEAWHFHVVAHRGDVHYSSLNLHRTTEVMRNYHANVWPSYAGTWWTPDLPTHLNFTNG